MNEIEGENSLPIEKFKNRKIVTKFELGQKVWYRNHLEDKVRWMPATVKQCLSPLTYLIEVEGKIRFVQENQIKGDKRSDINSDTKLYEIESDVNDKIVVNEPSVPRRSSRRTNKTKHFGDNVSH